LKEGEIIPGTVREVYPKSAVVDIGGIETRVGASEIAWGWVEDARDILERGKTYEVKVLSVDKENEQVEVSLKQALKSHLGRTAPKDMSKAVCTLVQSPE
jgi:ribosomal protein S1